MSDLLESTRRRVGGPNRRLEIQQLSPPPGLTFSHPWWPAHDDFRRVLRDGNPQLALVTRADSRLADGGADAGIVTLLLPPVSVKEPPSLDSMLAIAEDLDRVLNGPTPIDHEQKRLVEWSNDYTSRLESYELPRSIARFQPLRIVRAVVYPALLPRRRLLSWFLPVMVDPACDCVAMIPAGFWGDDFRRMWLEAGLSLPG